MKTKEISIEYEGKQEIVTIKRMGWAEKNLMMDSYFGAKIMPNNVIHVIPHMFKMKVDALIKCIINAPFKPNGVKLNESTLNEQDPEMLDKIYAEIESFNNLGKESSEAKKKLQELSGEEKKENLPE